MLEDWSGRKTFAEYASFRVESEAEFYKLRVGRYHGNAGDSLTWHNGKQFTTLDRDHDVYTGECNATHENTAKVFQVFTMDFEPQEALVNINT